MEQGKDNEGARVLHDVNATVRHLHAEVLQHEQDHVLGDGAGISEELGESLLPVSKGPRGASMDNI